MYMNLSMDTASVATPFLALVINEPKGPSYHWMTC
uniref:Uncharacterized protein n=1 Tax=Arundo donax TaxID=35708 RepID=A0A0A9C4J5_ARUDO